MQIVKGDLENLLDDAGIAFNRESFASIYPDAIEATRAPKFSGRKPAGANASKRETFAELYAQDDANAIAWRTARKLQELLTFALTA